MPVFAYFVRVTTPNTFVCTRSQAEKLLVSLSKCHLTCAFYYFCPTLNSQKALHLLRAMLWIQACPPNGRAEIYFTRAELPAGTRCKAMWRDVEFAVLKCFKTHHFADGLSKTDCFSLLLIIDLCAHISKAWMHECASTVTGLLCKVMICDGKMTYFVNCVIVTKKSID